MTMDASEREDEEEEAGRRRKEEEGGRDEAGSRRKQKYARWMVGVEQVFKSVPNRREVLHTRPNK